MIWSDRYPWYILVKYTVFIYNHGAVGSVSCPEKGSSGFNSSTGKSVGFTSIVSWSVTVVLIHGKIVSYYSKEFSSKTVALLKVSLLYKCILK